MKYFKFSVFIFFLLNATELNAQKILPGITVKNYSGKIVVSWQNAFTTPITNIFIQRSYDSLKNYSTIGSVLNPQNKENGYTDLNPPYSKMYYRVSITFEGGDYKISLPERPVKDVPVVIAGEPPVKTEEEPQFPWLANPLPKDSLVLIAPPKKEAEITYPSERIFTSKDNNVMIHLAEAPVKKYTAKFYNESDSLLFELTNLKEEYLILEKVNFVKAGWYHFEVFESGKLVEKNKFQILSKEAKAGNK